MSTRLADHPAIAAQRRATVPLTSTQRLQLANQRFSVDEFVLQQGVQAQLRRAATVQSVDYGVGTCIEVSCVEVAPARALASFRWPIKRRNRRVEESSRRAVESWEERRRRERLQRVGEGEVIEVRGKRKLSHQLSEGVVGVREFGRKVVRRVSKHWRRDSAQESPANDFEDEPLLQGASIESSSSSSPSPTPPAALSPSITDTAPIDPPPYTTATATDNTTDTSPLATPQSHDDPTSGLIFGPAANPSAIATWFDELETRLLALKASDLYLPSAREEHFDALLGNCTTPAAQWEAHLSHRREAEEKRVERVRRSAAVREMVVTKVYSDIDLPAVAGTAAGGQLENLPLRRVMARGDLSAASVAGVVGEATQRRGSEFERLSRC